MTISISVLIPCHNAAWNIGELVRSVTSEASFAPGDEIIVVDDRSADDSAQVAIDAGAKVFVMDVNSGPSVARNFAAESANNGVLLFLDADTRLEPGSLAKIKKHFESANPPACLNGMCSPWPLTPGFAQSYKGLAEYCWNIELHNSKRMASCFNTRIGAIRKDIFKAAGGFDARYKRAEVEDYEFSYRLPKGTRIEFDPSITIRHDFPGFMETVRAYYNRAFKWMALFRRRRRFDGAGTSAGNAGGHILGAVFPVCLLLGFIHPIFGYLGFAGFLLFVLIYRKFFQSAVDLHGSGFAFGCLSLHIFYSYVIVLGAALGMAKAFFSTSSSPAIYDAKTDLRRKS